jgi:hypothetical protein
MSWSREAWERSCSAALALSSAAAALPWVTLSSWLIEVLI